MAFSSKDAAPSENKSDRKTVTPVAGNKDLRAGGMAGYSLRDGTQWTLDKYYWSNTSAYEQRVNTGSNVGNTFPDIQRIIIREYQPNVMMDMGTLLDTLGAGVLASLFTPGGGEISRSFSNLFEGAAKSAATAANKAIEVFLINQALSEPGMLTASDSVGLMAKSMFSGPAVGYYECPFFEELFLDNKANGSWTQHGSARLGGSLASAAKAGANIDFPTTPTWALGDSKGFDFSFSFWLINKDRNALESNFKFLQSFIAGTFWLQLSVQQKSPNVYQIIVPGRFRKFFTSLNIRVEAHGKLRRLPDPSTISALNGNLMPEVWKVTVNVEDLTPNNFNAHAEFIKNGASGLPSNIEIITDSETIMNNPSLDENAMKAQYKTVGKEVGKALTPD